jgi:proteasome lid subunit RPN8/RPN11
MSATGTRSPAYQLRLEYSALDGTPIFEVPLGEQDFARAIETAFFDGLRRGRFRDYLVPSSGARVEPRFASRRVDSPLTKGFTVVVPAADGSEHRVDFDTDFLKSHAHRIAVDRVVQGELQADTFKYRLSAYLDESPPRPAGLGLTIEADEPQVPIREVRRSSLGRTTAWDNPAADDLPVLIPRTVLEEAVAEAMEVPECEVGGFLLGHLCRDVERGDLFLQITCHVPAEGTESTETSVTFTAQTWAAAREVIAWRGEGEIFAGWVHSHPFRVCAECPNPPKPDCAGKVLFFSPEDHFLMEVTFAQPFMVALQTAVEPRLEAVLGHLPVRLYGWRDGVVVPRGFEVIEE